MITFSNFRDTHTQDGYSYQVKDSSDVMRPGQVIIMTKGEPVPESQLFVNILNENQKKTTIYFAYAIANGSDGETYLISFDPGYFYVKNLDMLTLEVFYADDPRFQETKELILEWQEYFSKKMSSGGSTSICPRCSAKNDYSEEDILKCVECGSEYEF